MWFIKGCVREKRKSKIKGLPRERKIPNVWRMSPHGCLTKQRRLLPGKGIFTENKKGMRTLLKRLGCPRTMAEDMENANGPRHS